MEVSYEVYYISNTNIVFGIVFIFSAEWENDALARFICGKSHRSIAIWQSILWLYLSDGYVDDSNRMAFKKAEVTDG